MIPVPPTDPALKINIARNLLVVRQRIARAATAAGRHPHQVRLVGVSKTVPIEHVHAAFAAGLEDFGENRVQEALQKISRSTKPQIRWHLVGHLQSNKARLAVEAFAWIHSVDSVSLLKRIDEVAAAKSVAPQLLVQVNLSGETTKHGASEAETRNIFDAAAKCQAACVAGLMMLPPWSEDPEHARPYFERLRQLALELQRDGVAPDHLRELSMGMSHDLEVAVAEGATMVRVGTALFGKRTPPPPHGSTSA